MEHIWSRTLLVGVVLALLVFCSDNAQGITFDPPGVYQTGSQPESVAIGDVTSDGRDDVLLVTGYDLDPENDNKLLLFAQAADGSLQAPKKLDQTAAVNIYGSLVIGDFDDDGDNDAATGTPAGIDVFPQEDGTLSAPVLLPGTPAPVGDLEVDDVNGDGADDFVVITSTGVSALVQRAAGGFDVVPVSIQTAESLATGDVSGDELSDVVVVSNYDQPNALRIYEQQAAGGYIEHSIPLNFDADPNKIAVADVTGDALDDIVVTRGGNSNPELAVYWQTEGGTIDPTPDVYDSYDMPEAVKTMDMDGDEFDDVVVVHSGWNRVGVYLQAPDGYLYEEQLVPSPYLLSGADTLALGDISSDGLTDFAVAYYGGSLVVRRQRLPFNLSAAGHSDRRITASWIRPAGLSSEFIEVATSPEVYPDGRLAGLFLDENIVLYDDSLRRDQESYVAREALPPGTYYVHVRAWDDQVCFEPDRANCPDEVSGTSVVHIPPDPATATSSNAAPADTVVRFRALRAAARQSARNLRVAASMPEPGTITASGTVSVPNTSKTYRLRTASATADAGATVTLRLELSKKARRTVLRALKRHRRIVAKIVVTVRDRAGNTRDAKRTIRLTR
jgi:hypothetical protein